MAQKGATGDFFSFLQNTFFFSKNGQYFPTKKKKKWKKKFAAARLAFILTTRWTGNRLFFMDSLVEGNYLSKGGLTSHVYMGITLADSTQPNTLISFSD